MRTPQLTREICEAVARASGVPVSVKCRIGVYDTVEDMLGRTSAQRPNGDGYADTMVKNNVPDSCEFDQLHDFVSQVTSSGVVNHVVVHARAAILAGLSPAKNRKVPPLRYDMVHKLASEFPHIDVSINGGIWGMHSVNSVLADSDRVLAGVGTSLAGNSAHADSSLEQSNIGRSEMARNGPLMAGEKRGILYRHGDRSVGSLAGVMAGRWMLHSPLDAVYIDESPTLVGVDCRYACMFLCINMCVCVCVCIKC
jgi:tRNA-dihydrouridine synthase